MVSIPRYLQNERRRPVRSGGGRAHRARRRLPVGQTTSTQAIRRLSVLGFRSVSRTWQSLAARAWLHPHSCPRSWTSECLPKCVCVCVCVCVRWGGGSLYRAAANGSRGSWPIKPPRSGNPSCGTTHKGACVRLKSPSEHEDNLGGGGYKILVKRTFSVGSCVRGPAQCLSVS